MCWERCGETILLHEVTRRYARTIGLGGRRTMCGLRRSRRQQHVEQISIVLPAASLQQDRWQPLEFLIARVDLESAGFQGGNAKQRLRAFVPVNDRAADDLSLELKFGGCDVEGDLVSIRKDVLPVPFWLESDGFEARPWDDRVECSGIDQEFAGPATLRIRRIADGYVNILSVL